MVFFSSLAKILMSLLSLALYDRFDNRFDNRVDNAKTFSIFDPPEYEIISETFG